MAVTAFNIATETQVNEILNVLNDDKLIMGVYWDKTSSPVMTRTDASVDLVANVGQDGALVQNDFDNMPIYRDIEEVQDVYGNVFIKIPKFYIYRREGSAFKQTKISKYQHPNFYLPWCFWDFTNSKELDYVLIGKYVASLSADNTKLESKPNTYPLINKYIVDFRNYAKANNDAGNSILGYQQMDIHVHDVISALFEVEFATLDSQSIMQGYTTGQYTSTHLATVAETATNRIIVANATADLYRVGQAISVGTSQGGNQIFYGRTITEIAEYDASNKAITFDGDPVDIAVGNYLYNTGWKNGFSRDIAASSGYITANDGKYPCMYRGIENPWGNVWQWVDGLNINERQSWICKNAENYASNVFASPYEQLGYVNGSTDGYVKQMGFDPTYPFARLPVEAGASSSTYYSDYYYSSAGQRVALFGSDWNDGSYVGVWTWYLNYSSSHTNVAFGGRLVKKAL
jgi:hypothetical protein